jgi:hypothetical protein
MAGSGFLCFGTVKIRKAVITAAGRDQRRLNVRKTGETLPALHSE